jgi:hypothetical protein
MRAVLPRFTTFCSGTNRHVGNRRQHRTDHDPVDIRFATEVQIGAGEVALFANIFRSASAIAGA